MTAGARQQTSEQSPGGKASPVPEQREFLQAGREIAGRYRLERPLGHPIARPPGSHRTVWLARDEAGRPWALKIAASLLIEHEARMLSALSHRNIVRLHALIAGEAGPVLVLDYLPGGDLVSLAGAPMAHWLGALAEVLDALGWLHRQGIVHRDLKARNVLFGADERARLVDFGSARHIGSAWTDGGTTAAAVAPDRGPVPVAAADDVYAFAALVHELLHGAPPGSLRRPLPPAAAPLAAAVDACLESHAAAATVGLTGLRTVIESLRNRPLSQP